MKMVMPAMLVNCTDQQATWPRAHQQDLSPNLRMVVVAGVGVVLVELADPGSLASSDESSEDGEADDEEDAAAAAAACGRCGGVGRDVCACVQGVMADTLHKLQARKPAAGTAVRREYCPTHTARKYRHPPLPALSRSRRGWPWTRCGWRRRCDGSQSACRHGVACQGRIKKGELLKRAEKVDGDDVE